MNPRRMSLSTGAECRPIPADRFNVQDPPPDQARPHKIHKLKIRICRITQQSDKTMDKFSFSPMIWAPSPEPLSNNIRKSYHTQIRISSFFSVPEPLFVDRWTNLSALTVAGTPDLTTQTGLVRVSVTRIRLATYGWVGVL